MDIVLVKLSRPVKLDDHVNVACLPGEEDIQSPGTLCVTAGWGHEKEGQTALVSQGGGRSGRVVKASDS